jgi:mRNA interferase MazF
MQYKKDFDEWNIIKQKRNTVNTQNLFFYEKEIWWCSVGVNIGSEQDGKGMTSTRPVLVFKKINERTFIAIPLTSNLKEDEQHIPFYFEYNLHTLIVSQLRILDTKRLIKRMGCISNYLHLKTKKTVASFMC